MLRKRAIAEKPETIVRQYYKSQQKNLTEKEVKKLTNDYIRLQKDFFFTMYDNTRRTQNEKN